MELILSLLISNLAVNAVPAEKLAPVIMEAANKWSVDPVTLTRIIIVESRGVEKALNKATKDYGIAQININTAQAMRISHACLMDYKCNIDAAAKILSQFKRTCRYNVGTGSLRGKLLINCLHYERKIANIIDR